MDERLLQFRVGATVLAALILTAILVALLGDLPTLSVAASRYTVYVHFTRAPGVAADTPIRKSGILIGRVRKVEFADDGGVIVTLGIDGDVKLYKSEICRIGGSILGDADLEFVPGVSPSKEVIQDGELVAGIVRTDPLEVISNLEGDISSAIQSVSQTSAEISRLARSLADLLENNEEQVGRIVSKAEDTLDTIRRVSENFDSILGDPELQADLKQAITDFPGVISDARDAMEGIKGTIERANDNLENLQGLTEPLGEQGEQIVTRINSALGRVDGLAADLSQFTQALNTSEGSLGQLLNNPDLYQNLNQAAENVAMLTRQLRPILDDARVAIDKVARDPGGEVGVRGILRSRSGIK